MSKPEATNKKLRLTMEDLAVRDGGDADPNPPSDTEMEEVEEINTNEDTSPPDDNKMLSEYLTDEDLVVESSGGSINKTFRIPIETLKSRQSTRADFQKDVNFDLSHFLKTGEKVLLDTRPPDDNKMLSDYLTDEDLVGSGGSIDSAGDIRICRLKKRESTRADFQKDVNFDLSHFLETGEKVLLDEDTGMKRAAPQDFGFGEQLTHDHDVNMFTQRLSETQRWHTKESVRKKYLAPLLPVIQSSGTGKSRLFYQYRQANPTSCRSILLKDQDSPPMQQGSFDVEFEVPTDGVLSTAKDKLRELVESECQKCLDAEVNKDGLVEGGSGQNKVKDVVLLFDEAQHLTEKDDGYLFRALRWVIRERNFENNDGVRFRITIALAGTNSKLAHSFPEKKKSTGSSRYLDDPSAEYYNSEAGPFEPFQPFFTFRTQGCLSERHAPSNLSDNHETSEQTEYQQMIRFSRPLFALLHKTGKLDNDVEYDIAKKIALGNTSKWADDRRACLSVLATRVQMGETSTSVASDLVSRGYAHLTFFQNKSDQDSDIPNLASFAFLPDPVCARIAMCLMDDTYQFEKGKPTRSPRYARFIIKGAKKANLVTKMKDIFSEGMCLPAKGDVGEVAVALYLLFCGDVIRMEYNTRNEFGKNLDYHELSVDYARWMKFLWNGGKLTNDDGQNSGLLVNCIQFFRYSFPKPMSELADQSFLKSLYDKGCAIYCFTNTVAVDLVIACLDIQTGQYIPIFVSVKNCAYLSPSEGNKFLSSSFETLKNAGVEKGLLLLAIAGQDREVVNCRTYEQSWTFKDTLVTSESSADHVATIRNELRAGFLCLHGDVFGINGMLNDLSMVKKKQMSEVYCMHGEMIHATPTSTIQLPSSYKKSIDDFFNDTLGCVNDPPEGLSDGDGEGGNAVIN